MAKKSAEEGATKPAKAAKPAKKTAEETAKPAKPKYADMIAELIQDCENARVGVSRIGLLKGLHDKFGLGGADAEERERNFVNAQLNRALRKGVEEGRLRMAAPPGRKNAGHYKLMDKKAAAVAEGAKVVKKTVAAKSKDKASASKRLSLGAVPKKKAKKATPATDAAEVKKKAPKKSTPAADAAKAKKAAAGEKTPVKAKKAADKTKEKSASKVKPKKTAAAAKKGEASAGKKSKEAPVKKTAAAKKPATKKAAGKDAKTD